MKAELDGGPGRPGDLAEVGLMPSLGSTEAAEQGLTLALHFASIVTLAWLLTLLVYRFLLRKLKLIIVSIT